MNYVMEDVVLTTFTEKTYQSVLDVDMMLIMEKFIILEDNVYLLNTTISEIVLMYSLQKKQLVKVLIEFTDIKQEILMNQNGKH
jgi:hypothetical protein